MSKSKMIFCSLASGSSGNCYVIKGGATLLLADAGISGKQIKLRLLEKGFNPDNLSGILITHEHQDHVKGINALLKTDVPIYGTKGSLENIGVNIPEEKKHIFEAGQGFTIGEFQISSFSLSHDAAEPTGYCFEFGGRKVVIVTDTGIITGDAKKYIKESDILVLESNHDVNMLKIGPYPWFLKQRILSEKGHLSNEDAAQVLAEIAVDGRKRLVLLAHLSKENNFPEMALATATNILEEKGVNMKNTDIHILSRTEAGDIYSI